MIGHFHCSKNCPLPFRDGNTVLVSHWADLQLLYKSSLLSQNSLILDIWSLLLLVFICLIFGSLFISNETYLLKFFFFRFLKWFQIILIDTAKFTAFSLIKVLGSFSITVFKSFCIVAFSQLFSISEMKYLLKNFWNQKIIV